MPGWIQCGHARGPGADAVGATMTDERPEAPWDSFGSYLRSQRQLAQLSLRQLADLT